jgi:hypothetical protein
MTLPNDPDSTAVNKLAAAKNHALSQVAENEQIIADSIHIEEITVHHDFSVVDVRYDFTVMVPGCSGWSKPLS